MTHFAFCGIQCVHTPYVPRTSSRYVVVRRTARKIRLPKVIYCMKEKKISHFLHIETHMYVTIQIRQRLLLKLVTKRLLVQSWFACGTGTYSGFNLISCYKQSHFCHNQCFRTPYACEIIGSNIVVYAVQDPPF